MDENELQNEKSNIIFSYMKCLGKTTKDFLVPYADDKDEIKVETMMELKTALLNYLCDLIISISLNFSKDRKKEYIQMCKDVIHTRIDNIEE